MKYSTEGREEFLLNALSKREGFVQSIMLLRASFTGLIYFEEKKINLLTKSDGNLSLSKIFDFAIKRVCYKWWNCFSAKLFTNREILTLRYMNVRIILEDIKILLFSNVAFVIAFSKLCVILAKFIYTFSLFQLFWREAIGLKLHLSQN